MNKVTIIGIAGGTGSGKTTLTEQISSELGEDVTVIRHDSYYRAHHELTYEQRSQLNYDHPDAYETELLVEHLKALREGRPIEVPVYDFSAYDRTDETVTVYPARVVILEGIMLFASAEIRDLLDVKIFVDTDADVRILRRLTRDVEERGRTVSSVVEQYLKTVKPMHEAFVEPSKCHADIIVPNNGRNPVATELIIRDIKSRLA